MTEIHARDSRARQQRRFYFYSAIGFILPMVLGVMLGYSQPGFGERAFSSAYGGADYLKELGPFGLFFLIFLRNSFIGLLTVVSGIVLGLPTILIVVANGFVIGAIAGWLTKAYGAKLVALGLLPHGVIEVPALLICGAYGMRVGVAVVARLMKRDSVPVSAELATALSAYLSRSLPLFLVAALVESFVTPLIIFSAMS